LITISINKPMATAGQSASPGVDEHERGHVAAQPESEKIMDTDYPASRPRRVEYSRPPETDRVDPSLCLDELVERRAVISAALSEIAESTDSIKG
jgi:hypothetical protein